mmetsp:Transcript_36142/g.144484  ORF Transcript_36142/g.144484 Transcript_36142/m.144484 type:complete len:459 (+) Transcript_36142:147-1523(+)
MGTLMRHASSQSTTSKRSRRKPDFFLDLTNEMLGDSIMRMKSSQGRGGEDEDMLFTPVDQPIPSQYTCPSSPSPDNKRRRNRGILDDSQSQSQSYSQSQSQSQSQCDSLVQIMATSMSQENFKFAPIPKRPRRQQTFRAPMLQSISLENPYLNSRTNSFATLLKDIGPFTMACSREYLKEFQEINIIGSGDFSIVTAAKQRIDGCKYAIKRTRKPLHSNHPKLEALREVFIMSAMNELNPQENLLRLYSSWFENKGTELYIQMELCSKGSLQKLVDQGECSADLVKRATLHIARAISAIHSCGIVHRDVKPENILLADNGLFKLGDFGIAGRTEMVEMDDKEGDGRYLSGDRLAGARTSDDLLSADIFALGASALEVGSGTRLPTNGPEAHEIRKGQGRFYESCFAALSDRCGEGFARLVQQCIHNDSKERPRADELVKSLAAVVDGEEDTPLSAMER